MPKVLKEYLTDPFTLILTALFLGLVGSAYFAWEFQTLAILKSHFVGLLLTLFLPVTLCLFLNLSKNYHPVWCAIWVGLSFYTFIASGIFSLGFMLCSYFSLVGLEKVSLVLTMYTFILSVSAMAAAAISLFGDNYFSKRARFGEIDFHEMDF